MFLSIIETLFEALPQSVLNVIFFMNEAKEEVFEFRKYSIQVKFNKHFESSQKLLKSRFVNERYKKYSMLPNELLTFETTNFKNLKYY